MNSFIVSYSKQSETDHFYQKEPYLSQGVRYFSEGKYSVFYKIRGNEVFVIRIVNGVMDIPHVLAGCTEE